MAELLLELFSEEIPARMQRGMIDTLCHDIENRLKAENLYFMKITGHVTPRRMVVSVDGLSITQEDVVEEKRGPRVDAPQQAIDGFLRSAGLTLDQLEQRETDKGTFYFAVTEQRGKPTKDVLKKALEEILSNVSWPKSMRWGSNKIRWVRPLKNILCTFGGDVLPVNFGHLVANDNSQGHRFLDNQSFKATSLEELENQLNKHYVVLDSQKRAEIILNESRKLAESKGLELIEDEGLLAEVSGLVEYPQPLLGSIDDTFMQLPEEVLISSIRTHQKYFCLKDKEGNLTPYFIVISNMTSDDGGAGIVAGNERVLRARLSDAIFFWEQDHKTSLDERSAGLERMVFHAKLGTVAQKVERISALAKFIAMWIPHADLELVERAARLAKADLTTEMVGEFPELQGIMGQYYAQAAKEDPQVCDAIKHHYSPLGPTDEVPREPVTIAVALADKIDTLCGLFAADEKPTGSKDPFALRRAALGIIRILLENKLPMHLRIIFEQALKHYPKSLFKPTEEDNKKGLLGKAKNIYRASNPSEVVDELMTFFEERLKALLKGENVRHDLISAVLANDGEDDLLRAVQRVAALDKLLGSEDGANLLAAYKRAANIVRIEEKKDNCSYAGSPSKGLLENEGEIALYNALHELKPRVHEAVKNHRYGEAMTEVAKLRTPVDTFFEEVTVNAEDANVRKNRLKILSQMGELLHQIADFSLIEG